MSDDYSEVAPLLPIPNRTVKRLCADDSAQLPSVKVGHRQTLYVKPSGWFQGVFLCLKCILSSSSAIMRSSAFDLICGKLYRIRPASTLWGSGAGYWSVFLLDVHCDSRKQCKSFYSQPTKILDCTVRSVSYKTLLTCFIYVR